MESPVGLKVVFTGAAFGPDGQAILRSDLKAACISLGMVVYDNYTRGVDLLVASRKDTTKAQKAALHGVTVTTYPSFITEFNVVIQASTKAPRCPYVDTHTTPGQPHPSLFGGDLL